MFTRGRLSTRFAAVGGLVLGERLAPRHLGMALIAAGLGLIDGRVLAWRGPRARGAPSDAKAR